MGLRARRRRLRPRRRSEPNLTTCASGPVPRVIFSPSRTDAAPRRRAASPPRCARRCVHAARACARVLAREREGEGEEGGQARRQGSLPASCARTQTVEAFHPRCSRNRIACQEVCHKRAMVLIPVLFFFKQKRSPWGVATIHFDVCVCVCRRTTCARSGLAPPPAAAVRSARRRQLSTPRLPRGVRGGGRGGEDRETGPWHRGATRIAGACSGPAQAGHARRRQSKAAPLFFFKQQLHLRQ